MAAIRSKTSPFGRLLRQWRKARGVSQMELALRASSTPRYISFVETGRSRPGEQMVMRLADALDVPVRARNDLLEAAGFRPGYVEAALDDAVMASFRRAVRYTLAAHEPFPAFAINRWYDLVAANRSAAAMFGAAELPGGDGEGPGNLMRNMFGPGHMRSMIDNWEQVAWIALLRLRAEAAQHGPDERFDDLVAFVEQAVQDVKPPREDPTQNFVVCPNFRIGDQLVRTISTVARFGTAREVTLDELRIELIYPADDAAESFFRTAAAASE